MKALTFRIGEEKYGVNIEQVVTVEKNDRLISAIPHGSTRLKGVVNVRSRIIPIIDTRGVVLGEQTEMVETMKLIIIDCDKQVAALLVDDTDTIVDVEDEQLERLTKGEKEVDIVNLGNEAFVVLDLKSVLESCQGN